MQQLPASAVDLPLDRGEEEDVSRTVYNDYSDIPISE